MKKLSSLILWMCSLVVVVAQNKPTTCSAFLPMALDKHMVRLSDIEHLAADNYGQNVENRKKYWDVYSDRCNNPLYFGPNLSKPTGRTLDMNVKVRIATIKDGFAEVFVEHKAGAVNYPTISEKIDVLGWIPLDHLLLWSTCPTTDADLFRKAFVLRNKNRSTDAKYGRIYLNPDPAIDEGQIIETDITIYYVMKEAVHNGVRKLLLSRASRLNLETAGEVEGWVTAKDVFVWDHHLCLEPNWDKAAVDTFKSRGILAETFVDKRLTNKTQVWRYGQDNQMRQASTKYRLQPRILRFPLLNASTFHNDSLYYALFFGLQNSPIGNVKATPATINRPHRKVKEQLRTTAHTNLIVVMDATKGMESYYPVVADVLKQAEQYLKVNKAPLKIGAVLYRDTLAGDTNVVECMPMTEPSDTNLHHFFQNIGRNNYGTTAEKKDKSPEEALFKGMAVALNAKVMGYQPEHNNLVVVVGDCGHYPADTTLTIDSLITLAQVSRVQLSSIQVDNQEHAAYSGFYNQMAELFFKQIPTLYGKDVNLEWSPIETGIEARANQSPQLYATSMHRAPAGTPFTADEFKNILISIFKSFQTAVHTQLQTLNKQCVPQPYAYKGYTLVADSSNVPLWTPVCFMTSSELNHRIVKLQAFKAIPQNVADDATRQQFVNVFAGIIQQATGKTTDEVLQATFQDFTSIVWNVDKALLQHQSDMMSKTYTLAEILDPTKCVDADFKIMVSKMKRKVEDLPLLNNGTAFKYKFQMSGENYLWIPVSSLP